MAEHRLDIQISFETEEDAENLMAICEPLVLGQPNDEIVNSFAEELQKKIKVSKKSMTEMNAVGKEARSQVEAVQQAILDIKEQLKLVMSIRTRAEREMQDAVTVVHSLAQQVSDINDNINDSKALGKLEIINNAKEEATGLMDALNFLADMTQVNKSVVTGGRVTLHRLEFDKEYGGEKWTEKKGWGFDRK